MDYIDDDRDVILPEKPSRPRVDIYAEVERAVNEIEAEAGVAVSTKHLEAKGFWTRAKDGVQSWGARIRASWGGK